MTSDDADLKIPERATASHIVAWLTIELRIANCSDLICLTVLHWLLALATGVSNVLLQYRQVSFFLQRTK